MKTFRKITFTVNLTESLSYKNDFLFSTNVSVEQCMKFIEELHKLHPLLGDCTSISYKISYKIEEKTYKRTPSKYVSLENI